MIIQFSDFIIKENPYEGLDLLIEGINDAVNLPRGKILEYLMNENKLLAIPYLEQVIHKWNDTTGIFHETLINLYIEQIIAKQTALMKTERDEFHNRLLTFLEESEGYDPIKILPNIPKEGFLEEKAILYGKSGNYEEGLKIYLFLMGIDI